MSYPQGFLFQPSVSLALHSCPSFGSGVLLGPRTDELGRSSSGSAFAPYSGSATSPGFNTHLPYGGEPRAAATLNSFMGPGYDPSSGVSTSLDFHPFGALGPYVYGDPTYRKNATRDATATLKAWLNEHRKNPYPTKGEKIMLAIITKMTLTQVSTWFANARRRLKKENKMTWMPRNRSEDEEDDDNADLERHDDESAKSNNDNESKSHAPQSRSPSVVDSSVLMLDSGGGADPDRGFSDADFKDSVDCRLPRLVGPAPSEVPPKDHMNSCSAVQNQTPKPKLWSLAEMATSVDKHKGCTDPPLSGGAVPATPALRTTFTHRHLYYCAPSLPGYSYGALGPLQGSAQHSDGLQQTILQRADTRDRQPHSHELNTGTSST